MNRGALAAIFFDLDGTLCAPTVPFREVFGAVVAPVLERQRKLTLDGLHAPGDALPPEVPQPDQELSTLAELPTRLGLARKMPRGTRAMP